MRLGFGTFKGVFVPSILTILGVIMYLRLGWVLGNVGLFSTLAIVTTSSLITFLTALSIAATATNMRVGGGGAYYMISRSFGVEAGAAIGLPLYLAQALGISFYIAGFSESVSRFVPHIPPQWIGVGTLLLLAALAYYSADAALKIQFLIFLIIVGSLTSFFMGDASQVSPKVIEEVPARVDYWFAFAVFFPAVTGIEAGISMSGDLKNPAKSLPFGTIAAVVVGYIVYMAIPCFLAAGIAEEVLRTRPMVMEEYALFGEAILLGIWGATLSSALGALLGAPRTLQALAKDRVVPKFLSQGKGNSPRAATVVSLGVAFTGILFGDLNAIAPILSMFFLTSYGVLNLIAGVEGVIDAPSWRPKFKTPWWLSLLGACFCFGTMFMISPGATFIAAFCSIAVFIFMRWRNMHARWADLRRGMLNTLARYSVYGLSDVEKNVKSWRPNILVLSGSPTARWYLIELANSILRKKGFLTVATILPKVAVGDDRVVEIKNSIKKFLHKKEVSALVEVLVADDVMGGLQSLVRSCGLGPLVPNTFLFGETERERNFHMFAELILLIHALGRNVVMVRESKTKRRRKGPQDKRIDVWWIENRQNAGFMLALAYMMQNGKDWEGSQLTLKSIAKSPSEQEVVQGNLKKFLEESRMDSQLEVLLEQSGQGKLTTIKKQSEDADLVFVGMRPPKPKESAEEYSHYYRELLKRTDDYPLTCFVLAGEALAFDKIFA